MALLAALISEHKLIARMLDYPTTESGQIFGLLDAYDASAKALTRWKTATVLT